MFEKVPHRWKIYSISSPRRSCFTFANALEQSIRLPFVAVFFFISLHSKIHLCDCDSIAFVCCFFLFGFYSSILSCCFRCDVLCAFSRYNLSLSIKTVNIDRSHSIISFRFILFHLAMPALNFIAIQCQYTFYCKPCRWRSSWSRRRIKMCRDECFLSLNHTRLNMTKEWR